MVFTTPKEHGTKKINFAFLAMPMKQVLLTYQPRRWRSIKEKELVGTTC